MLVLAFQPLEIYTHLRPAENMFLPTGALSQSRLSRGSREPLPPKSHLSHTTACRSIRRTSPPIVTTGVLSGRKRQRHDQPWYGPQSARVKMALGQQQPVLGCFTSRPPIFNSRSCGLASGHPIANVCSKCGPFPLHVAYPTGTLSCRQAIPILAWVRRGSLFPVRIRYPQLSLTCPACLHILMSA